MANRSRRRSGAASRAKCAALKLIHARSYMVTGYLTQKDGGDLRPRVYITMV